jgi:hypothetical protein
MSHVTQAEKVRSESCFVLRAIKLKGTSANESLVCFMLMPILDVVVIWLSEVHIVSGDGPR